MKFNYSLMVIVFLLIFTIMGFAQWSTDPAENTRISTYGLGPFITTDGNGGGIIAWHDDYYYIDIVVQRVDSAGYIKWSTDGVPICRAKLDQSINDIVSDGQGGAFIAWQDYRRSAMAGFEMDSSDVYLQHVDSNGNILWQEDGVRVSNGSDYSGHAKMIEDGMGGIIVAWMNEHEDYPYSVFNSIDIQHVTGAGELLWQVDSVRIIYTENKVHTSLALVESEPGSFLLSCAEGIFKFNLDGEVLWHIANIPGRLTDYSFVSDGAGGAIFWYTNHVNFNYNLYLQRVNSNGELLWGENGVFVTTKIPRYWGTSLAPNGKHGAYISWIDSSYTYHYNQIDSSGNLLWDDDSLSFGTLIGAKNLLSDIRENVIMVYCDSLGSDKGFIQKLDRIGKRIWDQEHVLFSYSAMRDSDPTMINDGNNGAIIVWYERYSPERWGIFAQRVNKYGKLGCITTVKQIKRSKIPPNYALYQNWPNPFNNQTMIQYKLPQKGKVLLTFFNIQGKEVIRLIDNEQPAGHYRVIWNGKDIQGGDVASGIYFYQLKVNEFIQTKKLTLIR